MRQPLCTEPVTVMPMPSFVLLEDRGVLALTGDDRVPFLQGLTTNDVGRVAADRVLFSAFLTPQGKYLHDFFMAAVGDALLLDCEAARRDDLLRRLRIYRLRSAVTLEDATARFVVAALIGDDAPARVGLKASDPGAAAPFADGLAYRDPRLPALGGRAFLPRDHAAAALAAAGLDEVDARDYHRLRLSLGVPDGSRDMVVEKSTLLESNFDELGAISWDKGCYLGQELTARTRYRGLVKKRLVPVTVDGPLPPGGTPVTLDGREVGEMRGGADGLALALIRLDALTRATAGETPLVAAGATLTPHGADGAKF